VSIRSLAAGPDEAGFWPVTNWLTAMIAPVLDFGKDGTQSHQFILDKEGPHLLQAYLVFLAITETRAVSGQRESGDWATDCAATAVRGSRLVLVSVVHATSSTALRLPSAPISFYTQAIVRFERNRL